MRRLLGILSVVAIALFLCSQVRAQAVASITGEVTDASGAVVPNVTVTLENPTTGSAYKGATNSVGSYTISNVPPGPAYKITFTAAGFSTQVITGLYMNVNSTRTQNAILTVGAESQTVSVTADAETVTMNTTDATVGNNFQVQFMQELPVQNRDNPAALFYQQPGVTLDGTVTGARTDQSRVTVDGLDVNDYATGEFGTIVGNAPVDSVQEFRAVTAGDLSTTGQGGGGKFELVTKSGSDQFHGDINWYHRDTAMTANDWFNNNSKIPRAPLIRNYYGGAIGGPIKRDKAFFFFDFDGRHDTLSTLVKRTVPSTALRSGLVAYKNTSGAIVSASAATLKTLDPAGIGYDQALLSIVTQRYPAPNDLTVGDGLNTAGYDFNAPAPRIDKNYVGRVDYNLTQNQKLWGKVSFLRTNRTYFAIQFPGDPQTAPFLDKSYSWAVGHTWAIGTNKTNQAMYGEVFEDFSFPITYNPNGVNQFYFGGSGTGSTIFSNPYRDATNAQARTYPVPVIRDDFTWQKGRHNIQFGGTFKYLNPHGNTIFNYNSPFLGLGGHLTGLSAAQRPADIASSSRSAWDRAYTFALGRYASVNSIYNYDAKGNVLPQGSGANSDYRYYETELYVGDTWKTLPNLTISAGVRWQNYSVPYEKNGLQSVPTIGFDDYFNARIAQSKAGAMGTSTDCNAAVGSGVPCVSYILGGKANNGPAYFNTQWTNFAPRVAFAWSPQSDRKTVVSGGAGIIYDQTVVNAIQYQATQFSYLFQTGQLARQFGVAGDPVTSLKNDPRFTGFSSPPAGPPAPAALKPPYTPYVSSGSPFGLANGAAYNEAFDKNLKTPYSISMDFGIQHEFPKGYLLKANYVGRLGRRLLGQVDANQLIDFPDKASGQMMSTAMANLTKQVRAGGAITPQPWFENVVTPGVGPGLCAAFLGTTCANNTEMVAAVLDPLPARGDFADVMEALSSIGILPDNVGMGSQFSEFSYYTNKGFSSYNGMLVTLHKNIGQGLQFDFNYTWSHSIDNVSIGADQAAYGGYGFICDALRMRSCRGNSDFDVTNYFNGNFIYSLPIGRGQQIGGTSPFWLNELIGGWQISGLPSWHTGNAYSALSNGFVAGFANNAPAILTGPEADLKTHVNKDAKGTLWAFTKQDAVVKDFVGPIGFQVGSRNNLRGPGYFNIDAGVAKTFPLYEDKVNLKFRMDAFNALNHPNFQAPFYPSSQDQTVQDNFSHADITETTGQFGVITATANSARVLQGSLRIEF